MRTPLNPEAWTPRFMKPKAWTLRVSLKSSLDRVAQKRKLRLGVYCWGPVVAVVVSLVLVLSSLWSGFPCCGWLSCWLPPFVSKERAATQEPTNFSSRIQLIGTVQRTGTLSGIPNGCGNPPPLSLSLFCNTRPRRGWVMRGSLCQDEQVSPQRTAKDRKTLPRT